MSRRISLGIATLLVIIVSLSFYYFNNNHQYFRYMPECWAKEKVYDRKLRPEYIIQFAKTLYALRDGPSFHWDGEVLIRDQHIFFSKGGIDYNLMLNAETKTIERMAHQQIAQGRTVPAGVRRWHELDNRPVNERLDQEHGRAFCDVVEWIALAPSE